MIYNNIAQKDKNVTTTGAEKAPVVLFFAVKIVVYPRKKRKSHL